MLPNLAEAGMFKEDKSSQLPLTLPGDFDSRRWCQTSGIQRPHRAPRCLLDRLSRFRQQTLDTGQAKGHVRLAMPFVTASLSYHLHRYLFSRAVVH